MEKLSIYRSVFTVVSVNFDGDGYAGTHRRLCIPSSQVLLGFPKDSGEA